MPKPPGRHGRPPGGSAHRLPGAEGLLPRSSSHHRRLADAPLGRAIRELRLPSPSSLAGPQGSPMWVLRVRSGRGPTFRTAHRGTTSAWMGHATGPNCPGQRGYLPDRRTPEPLFASAFSPEITARTSHASVVRTLGPDPSLRDVGQIYRPLKVTQAPMFLRVSSLRCARGVDANP